MVFVNMVPKAFSVDTNCATKRAHNSRGLHMLAFNMFHYVSLVL